MRIRPAKTVFGVSLALLIALSFVGANAQSGRRQAKPAPAAPVPSPTPESKPTPKPKEDDEDQVNFFVATGSRGARVSRAPLYLHDAATTGCAEQLRKRTSYDVAVSLKEVSRGEAIDKAKAATTTYVVLVSVLEDVTDYQTTGYMDFEVDYVVFAPGTAKVMASGRTYEGARKGPVTVGPRGPGMNLPSYREAALRRAGEDAANRIVKALHLSDPVPPRKNTFSARTPAKPALQVGSVAVLVSLCPLRISVSSALK
jgi:hypothetical protein